VHRGGRLGAMLSTTLAASPLTSVDCLAGISWLERCRGRGPAPTGMATVSRITRLLECRYRYWRVRLAKARLLWADFAVTGMV
jgi:hypothetical protein